VRYRYIGSVERIYVDRSLVVSPGELVDWPAGAPEDGQWQPVDEDQVDDDPTNGELAPEVVDQPAAVKPATTRTKRDAPASKEE
jgi:hypothetical protein